jgi:hypothetical protein
MHNAGALKSAQTLLLFQHHLHLQHPLSAPCWWLPVFGMPLLVFHRQSQAAWSFVINLIVPGTPVISLVAVFVNEHHPSILEGPPPAAATAAPASSQPGGAGDNNTQLSNGRPLDTSSTSSTLRQAAADASGGSVASSNGNADGPQQQSGAASSAGQPDTRDWEPFDHVLYRFLHAGDEERTSMLKLIPCIAEGSWVIKQSVGTVPVIVGTKLATSYYQTERYLEASVDVTSNSAAAYITGGWSGKGG